VSLKGRKFSEEHKQKISQANKGRKLSAETKLKISLAQKGKKYSDEYKLNMSRVMKGRKFTDEWKRKISEAHKGIGKGRICSLETRQKMSKTRKERFAKMSIKEKKEYGLACSKGMKKVWSLMSKEEKARRMSFPTQAALLTQVSKIEKKVCKVLNKYKIKYKIQVPFCYGKFIVDIFIPSKKIVIECNGDYWHDYKKFPERKIRDNKLKKYLNKWGYKIIWLWEAEINKSPELAVKMGFGDTLSAFII
jgi:very-short-patch-repair endonuclease